MFAYDVIEGGGDGGGTCYFARGDDHVGAESAEFPAEAAFGVHFEIQQRGGKGRSCAESQQDDQQASTLSGKETTDDAPEHFAIGHLFSPQNGRRFISRSAAQRDGATQQGDERGQHNNHHENQNGRFGGDAEDFFAEDARQDDAESVTDATADKREQQLLGRERKPIVPEPAPMAFIKPISERRSMTDAAEDAPTAKTAASKAAKVASQSKVRTRVRIVPSPSATRRITRASTPGKTCWIW